MKGNARVVKLVEELKKIGVGQEVVIELIESFIREYWDSVIENLVKTYKVGRLLVEALLDRYDGDLDKVIERLERRKSKLFKEYSHTGHGAHDVGSDKDEVEDEEGESEDECEECDEDESDLVVEETDEVSSEEDDESEDTEEDEEEATEQVEEETDETEDEDEEEEEESPPSVGEKKAKHDVMKTVKKVRNRKVGKTYTLTKKKSGKKRESYEMIKDILNLLS
jgi:cobalamin biosynthesis protein CobT